MRHSLRALNGAIERGAEAADLTLQQQAFLLAMAARGGRRVPLAAVRADLDMDQATASELLGRLVGLKLVRRETARDRRALDVSMTSAGRTRFRQSVAGIREHVRTADRAGDLRALRENIAAYLDHYIRSEH